MRRRLFAALAGLGLAAVAVAVAYSVWWPTDIDPRPLEFVDVAGDVGLDVSHSAFRWEVTMDPVAMMGAGVCWLDVDNDGWLDLFVTDTWSDGEWGRWQERDELPTTRLFRNTGEEFVDATDALGAGIAARGNGCVAADLDGDGFTDLYVTTERQNLLLWNQGGTGFVEGAAAAGVEAYGWTAGVAAGDIDSDGLIDLVVTGYADLNRPVTDAQTGFPNTFEPIADWVFLNRGETGRPTFSAVDAGLEPDGLEYGLGVVLTDFDADGDLDLHVANDTQPNRLYRNESVPGQPRFVDISADSGADDPNSGMGIATSDVDDDLLPDLVVTNLAGQGHVALRSESDAAFSAAFEAVRQVGMEATGWGTSFGDFDNDGDVDLLIASGAIPIVGLDESSEQLTYVSNEGGVFVDATTAVGIDALAPRNGRSVAVADYDNDGDLDAVVSAIGQPLMLLQNRLVGGDWLIVDPGSPVPGMRVQVLLESGRTIQRVHHVGSSWLSSEDPRVHIGLGKHDVVSAVWVWAPNGDLLYEGNPRRNATLEVRR